MTTKELFQIGYEDGKAMMLNMQYVNNEAYMTGYKMAEEDRKEDMKVFEIMINPLYRIFSAYDEDGEKVDPIDFIFKKIREHNMNGGELPKGVYLIGSKRDAIKLANQTGHAMVEIKLEDSRGIPLREGKKEKYYIELPWYFKDNGKNEALSINTYVSTLLNWNHGKVYLPNEKKWFADVIKLEVRKENPFERWMSRQAV
jgi:hypothetical protein